MIIYSTAFSKSFILSIKPIIVSCLFSVILFSGLAQQNTIAKQPSANTAQSPIGQRIALYNDLMQTDSVITADNNIIKGTTIESAKKLQVSLKGMHMFIYTLNPASLSLTGCRQTEQTICYDCLYDLTIVITGDSNNIHLPDKQPYVISRRNFSLAKPNTNCTGAPFFDLQDSLFLEPGVYTVLKRLSISVDAMNYYRDSIYSKNSFCQSFSDILLQQQKSVYSHVISYNYPDSNFTKTQNKFYTDNCNAYVHRWWLQLGPCNYSAADSAIIIPRLLGVCKDGSSISRPFGSSSILPESGGRFKSFEDVIKQYNDSAYDGKKNIIQCSSYLIDRPLPYQSSVITVNAPVNTKPKECECAQINQLYTEYEADSSLYNSFSNYLQQKYHTTISQNSLDILRGLCSNTTETKLLLTPIQLPALMQCNAGDICKECKIVKPVFASYVNKFGVLPARNETNNDQQKVNSVFAHYMNQHLGFNKSCREYLDFLDSCQKFEATILTDTTATGNSDPKLLQGPLLCETNTAIIDPSAEAIESSDSTSFPFISAVEIYRSYTKWLYKLFNERYVEKCLGAASLESFTVKHPRSYKAVE